MIQHPFDHSKFSLARMRSFVRVYDAGSIAAAARSMANPVAQQSQMSRQLSELSEVFGQELFEGVGRARRPTPLADRLARLFRDFEDGLHALQADAQSASVLCTIGAGNSVLHWLLLPRLHVVNDGLPRALAARLQWQPAGINNLDIHDHLANGRLDLGIVFGQGATPGENRKRLGKLGYALFAARDAVPEAPDWQTLINSAPLAAVTTEPSMCEAIDRLGVEVRSHCGTFPQVARAVETGRWVGILPEIARIELPETDFWMVRAPPLTKLTTTLWLAARPRLDEVRPDLSAVRDMLAEVLADALAQANARASTH